MEHCAGCRIKYLDMHNHGGRAVGIVHHSSAHFGFVAVAQEPWQIGLYHYRARGNYLARGASGNHVGIVCDGLERPGGIGVGCGKFHLQ